MSNNKPIIKQPIFLPEHLDFLAPKFDDDAEDKLFSNDDDEDDEDEGDGDVTLFPRPRKC